MKRAREGISALFSFNQQGQLKGVFLNSKNEGDQKVLETGLSDLLKPGKFFLIKKLFRRPVGGN